MAGGGWPRPHPQGWQGRAHPGQEGQESPGPNLILPHVASHNTHSSTHAHTCVHMRLAQTPTHIPPAQTGGRTEEWHKIKVPIGSFGAGSEHWPRDHAPYLTVGLWVTPSQLLPSYMTGTQLKGVTCKALPSGHQRPKHTQRPGQRAGPPSGLSTRATGIRGGRPREAGAHVWRGSSRGICSSPQALPPAPAVPDHFAA